MRKEQHEVEDFMTLAGQATLVWPKIPSKKVQQLRLKLIREELKELRDAFTADSMVDVYDAIIDLLYVTIGTANACGLDIEPGWEEVHRSNMTKFIDGHRRPDGKWVKGPSYRPANLVKVLHDLSFGQPRPR